MYEFSKSILSQEDKYSEWAWDIKKKNWKIKTVRKLKYIISLNLVVKKCFLINQLV